MRIGVHRHGHTHAPGERRQPVAGDLRPGHAFIGRLEKIGAVSSGRAACRGSSTTAATTSSRSCARGASSGWRRSCRRTTTSASTAAASNRGCQDHFRMIEGPRQILRTGQRVDEKRARPVLAAVGGTEDAAIAVGGAIAAERRHEHEVGILGIDEHQRNRARLLHAEMLPALPGVGGLVHAVTLVHAAGSDVHDVGIRWRHLDRADRRHILDIVKDREPGDSGAGRLPHPADRQPHVKHARLSDRPGDRAHSTGAEGPDVAPLEAGDQGGLDRRAQRRGVEQWQNENREACEPAGCDGRQPEHR